MIILTGGTGFIGSNILADLNAQGQTDIVIVDHLGSGNKWRNIAKHRFADIIHPNDVEKYLINRCDVSAIIHMGADSSTTTIDGDSIVRTNLRASMALWDWCTSNRRQFIYASSAATYGDGSAGFIDREDENFLSKLRPLNLYGWSKHTFDRWSLERAQRGESPPHWAGLKFFNVYGPNESHKGAMMSLVAKAYDTVVQGEEVQLFRSHRPEYQDGEQLRDFVYVKDCSAIIMWMLSYKPKSGIYNVGTGKPRSFRDLINCLGKALGRDASIKYIDMPVGLRSQYQYFTKASVDKIIGVGYNRAFTDIEVGVMDYVRSHLACKDQYR